MPLFDRRGSRRDRALANAPLQPDRAPPPPPLFARLTVPRSADRGDWHTIRTLLPYLLAYKGRVLLALACLVAAKVANVGVPLVLKQIVDSLTARPQGQSLVLPLALLVAYGVLRLSTTAFTELREYLFAKVTQRAVRTIALKVFRHLHALSLRFHLARQTGGLTRDVERGTRGISTLIGFTLFSILPTLVEIALVSAILVARYDLWFIGITLGALVLYIVFTVTITEWRTGFRRQMNELDSKANTRAIDSLLNYETVKYFGNEEFEARRYDESLQRWETRGGPKPDLAVAAQHRAERDHRHRGDADHVARDARRGRRHDDHRRPGAGQRLHDPALHPAQLPRRHLSRDQAGAGRHGAHVPADRGERRSHGCARRAAARGRAPARCASSTSTSATKPNRQILFDVSFTIPAGRTVAVVGPSGSGKSTLARLLYRFYDVSGGRITIDGQDMRAVQQASAARGDRHRAAGHGAVQRLDRIQHRLRPARRDARRDRRRGAARADPRFHRTACPRATRRRSASAGSSCRAARSSASRSRARSSRIRAILIFDEATSALDSKSEKAIQAELEQISRDRTTLTIAHRLSTIVDADEILVLEHGRIVERGTHADSARRRRRRTRGCGRLQQDERASPRGRPATSPEPAHARRMSGRGHRAQALRTLRLIGQPYWHTAPCGRAYKLRAPT